MRVCYIVLHFNKQSIDLPREHLVVPLSVSTEERRRAENPSPLQIKMDFFFSWEEKLVAPLIAHLM